MLTELFCAGIVSGAFQADGYATPFAVTAAPVGERPVVGLTSRSMAFLASVVAIAGKLLMWREPAGQPLPCRIEPMPLGARRAAAKAAREAAKEAAKEAAAEGEAAEDDSDYDEESEAVSPMEEQEEEKGAAGGGPRIPGYARAFVIDGIELVVDMGVLKPELVRSFRGLPQLVRSAKALKPQEAVRSAVGIVYETCYDMGEHVRCVLLLAQLPLLPPNSFLALPFGT